MKRKNNFIFLIFVIFISSQGFSQTFNTSNFINSSDNVRVAETVKLSDGYVIFGDFIGTMARPTTLIADSRDAFLAKYDMDFNLMWIKHISGADNDLAYDLTIDPDGNVYLIGSFRGSCAFNGLGNLISDGNFDVFIAKYNSTGTFQWSKKAAYNTNAQFGTSIDFDGTNLIIGGYFSTSIDFDSQNFTSATGMYYAKFDSDGTFIWAKSIPTTHASSTIQSVSAFTDGYYFNGRFRGTATFDVGVYNSNNASYTDVFLYKTDFNGNGQWVRRSYGDSNAFTGTMAQDPYGNLFFTGLFNGTSMSVDSTSSVKGIKPLINKGNSDIFILKYNKNGTLTWAKAYGRSGSEWARDIKFKNDALYVTGYFSDTIVFGNDTLTSSAVSDQDAFMGIFDTYGNKLRASKIDDSNVNNESGLTISIDTDNTIYWGGSFISSSVIVGDSTFLNPNFGKQCVYITKGGAPLSVAYSLANNPSCNLSNDGKLIITPYFGVAPYIYNWSHDVGLNDSTATGLSAGTYRVTVTGALGTKDSAQYVLTEPNPFLFKPVVTDVSLCSYNANGAINLNVTGGNGGNSYNWFESEGGSGVVLTDEDQTGLTVGRYDVTVTDSKACTSDTTIYITGPNPVLFSSTIITDDSGVDPIHNGEIDLELIGGTGTPSAYAASWTGPSGYTASVQDIVSLISGNYDVTVTDANTCTFDSMFTVIDLDTLFAYIPNKKDDCNAGPGDGWATVAYYTPNPTPVISYLWSNGNTTDTASGLIPGWYYVTVTESDSAWTYVDSVEIFDLGYVIAGNLAGPTVLDCKGDADGYIDLTITTPGQTPYIYNWTSGQSTQDITGLIAGTYGVTVTDNNSCTLELINYIISEPVLDLTAIASVVSDPLCNGDFNGVIRVDAAGGNGGYTYKWDDPGSQTTQIANGLNANSYTVTVTDSKACTSTDVVNLTQPAILMFSAAITNLDCFGDNNGSVILTVTGGTPTYSYSWTTLDGSGLVPTDKDQTGLTSGTYDLTITDLNLCEITDGYILTEPTAINIFETAVIDVTCNGFTDGSIDITVSGGTVATTYTYNWSTSDGSGLVPSSEDQTGLSAGTYDVTVTDDNLCTATRSILINELSVINIAETSINNISCFGLVDGNIDITASGGSVATVYTYNWFTGDGSGLVATSEDQAGLSAGTYDVTVSDDNFCVAFRSIVISEPSPMSVALTSVNNITCFGLLNGSIDVTASDGTVSNKYVYYWATVDGPFVIVNREDQTGLGVGTYNLTVTDDNLCTATTSAMITQPNAIIIDEDTFINASSSTATDGSIEITASGGTGSLVYTIIPDGSSNATGVFLNLAPTNYVVEVTDDNSCGPVTKNYTISFPEAIHDANFSKNIKIFPNPTSSKLNLEINIDEPDTYIIEVYSISGQVLLQEQFNSAGFFKKEIDLSKYSKGIYFIKMSTNKYYYQEKIILQ